MSVLQATLSMPIYAGSFSSAILYRCFFQYVECGRTRRPIYIAFATVFERRFDGRRSYISAAESVIETIRQQQPQLGYYINWHQRMWIIHERTESRF